MFLRQSTAQIIRFGPCLDKDDGVTEETGLTLTQAEMRLSKDGGAFAQKSAAGNATHDSDGWYSTTLSTTDTNTVGELYLNVQQPANMLPVWVRWWVLEEAVYDDFYGAAAPGYLKPTTATRTLDVTATGEAGVDFSNVNGALTNAEVGWVDGNDRVDVGQWLGTAVTTSATTAKPQVDVDSISDDATAPDNLELDYDGTGYNKANSTIGTTTTNTDMRGTNNAALASVLGALADAAADGDPTNADTLMQYTKQLINILIGTTGVVNFPAEAAPANNVSLAEVLRAIYNDTVGLGGSAMRGTDNALLAASVNVAAGRIESDVQLIEGSDPTDQIRDSIVDDATRFSGVNVDAAISTRATPAQVNTEVSDVLKTDTIAEMAQQAPPTNPTFEEALMYVYMALAHKLDITATLKEFHNNAGTVIWKKTLSDDGITYSEADGVTGP